MANPFDTSAMAVGYAKSRPPVHPQVVALVRERLGVHAYFDTAIDIGCGAGLSTAPLTSLAARTIGMEPSVAMLDWSSSVAPRALFLAGKAEALPFRDGCANLVTAAGSLNWVDLDRFFPELHRILAPEGILVIYDFGQGREMRDGAGLVEWESEFKRRYPSPPCRAIHPDTLELPRRGFRLNHYEQFEVWLTLSPDFYLAYAMTETNVTNAIQNGTPEPVIREWCRSTLEPVFQGVPHDVLFRGFIACITPVSGSRR